MCMLVYLAADISLGLIAWNDSAPAFNTSALAPDEERVRVQFSKPNVIYAGSYEGCSCGFQLGKYRPHPRDAEEREQQRKSLREFADYLREQLLHTDLVEVFACWDGDQGAAPEHRRTLTPSALENDSFFFLEKELSTVVREGT